MKGIILAGGSGTRLYPATLAINKQLLPVYDKPMVYYPLSVLMLAGIREILLFRRVSTAVLSSACWAMAQPGASSLITWFRRNRSGLPMPLFSGAIRGRRSRRAYPWRQLILRSRPDAELTDAAARADGATVFAYYVSDPSQYGVLKFDKKDVPVDIIEKPANFISNWAVTGLYFYDNSVLDIAARLASIGPWRA